MTDDQWLALCLAHDRADEQFLQDAYRFVNTLRIALDAKRPAPLSQVPATALNHLLHGIGFGGRKIQIGISHRDYGFGWWRITWLREG